MKDASKLNNLCRLIRFSIITSTTQAGSGHPTTSLSAVELMASLFFNGFLSYNVKDPKYFLNDRVIYSKGHAAPLLYSLYHAASVITTKELMSLRKFDSPFEGHPTPRLPFVDVATGSLGQGLSVGIGMALGIKLKIKQQQVKLDREPKVFVLLGDSEFAEGQIWEALQLASYYKLNNLIGILDVNRLGQRGETMVGWDLKTYEKRISSFGWNTIVVDDGNDLKQVSDAYEKALQQSKQPVRLRIGPTMIIAKTIKGKGISFMENKDGWHGKPVPKDRLQEALKELGNINLNIRGTIQTPNFQFPISPLRQDFGGQANLKSNTNAFHASRYTLHDSISTREAYGDGLIMLGKANPDIVVLDAETSNSTFAEKFKKEFPDRFFEMFIAEQNMVSVALGISKIGFIPFASSFAAFLTRAFDQMRIAQYSDPNLKITGSHAGVSIGEDGPSQMALEDIAMARSMLESIVLYPSDAASTLHLTKIMMEKKGLFFMRTTREKTPVIYNPDEIFEIGGSKIHQPLTTNHKPQALIISAGITLHEALKAQKQLAEEGIETVVMDCYSIKPLDVQSIKRLTKEIKNIIVVEDHYPYGGIGEAVLSALTTSHQSLITNHRFVHLCVHKQPRSGKPAELLRYEEIDAEAIIKKVKIM